jgi:hypothetical protein
MRHLLASKLRLEGGNLSESTFILSFGGKAGAFRKGHSFSFLSFGWKVGTIREAQVYSTGISESMKVDPTSFLILLS